MKISVVSLSPMDGEILDAMLQNGSPGGLTVGSVDFGSDRADSPQRAEKLQQIGTLLNQYGDEAVPDNLSKRTLEHIHDAKQRVRFAQQVQALGGSRQVGFQWAELVAVAAIFMIGVSLVWPTMERIRTEARRVACSSNLAVAGQAFGRYASDHQGVLPRGKSQPGAVWWNVGASPSHADDPIRSNSAHLYILVKFRYVDADHLRCPDNPSAVSRMDASMHDWPDAPAVSYSYQNQFTVQAIRLDHLPNMAILADKNPLFVKPSRDAVGLAYRSEMDPTSPSNFHGRQGQNILTSSGQVIWRTQPVRPNGDNIWLIQGVSDYLGVEIPATHDDSFLVP